MTSSRAPRLGRGLAALLGDVAAAPSLSDPHVRILPVASLVAGPFQPRTAIDNDRLQSLAASIGSSGVLQPILVRPDPEQADRFQIIAGERRWRAAQIAALHDVPCLVRALADVDAMVVGLVENLQREDLNVLEEAEGLQRLVREHHLPHDEIGRTVGRSRSHVANTIRLLALPAPVLREVRAGNLSAGHARALLTHPDPAKAALHVLSHGLSVRQTEALAQDTGRQSVRRERRSDPETRALEHDLSAKLGLALDIRHRGPGGEIRIRYGDLDQLDGVVALLSKR